MTDSVPSISLEPGLEIGYGAPLASIETQIELGGGTHFLIARNGRGKTTLLRTLARTLKPVAGHFLSRGHGQYLPEDLRFDPEIPATLIFRSMLPKNIVKSALELAGRLELDVKKPYGRLSTGNRRKVHLIMAESSVKEDAANILLLDEPFSGMDAFARQVFEEIWQSSARNVLRLVSCHPDYDSMVLTSALMIEGNEVRHLMSEGQTWSELKGRLN
jgi:ABC-type multidrug transport system ATPase subunit